MDDQGLTAVNFAKKCGVNQDTIGDLGSKVGYGPRKPTLNKILKAALEYDPDVTYEKLFPPM